MTKNTSVTWTVGDRVCNGVTVGDQQGDNILVAHILDGFIMNPVYLMPVSALTVA